MTREPQFARCVGRKLVEQPVLIQQIRSQVVPGLASFTSTLLSFR